MPLAQKTLLFSITPESFILSSVLKYIILENNWSTEISLASSIS